jgi:hypothetical protein
VLSWVSFSGITRSITSSVRRRADAKELLRMAERLEEEAVVRAQ